jgi:transglutaminase-like putative cysteine protease
MLAACRRAGIPSRYVSGYLHDPVEGSDVASHAWVDVLDSERGWVSLDPTHDREQTEAYVRVAVGRDYADVPPTRGVFKGTAEETLDVAVRISVL